MLSIEDGLSRKQWFEFASVFFSGSTVSFFMAVVHLWTGLLVQVVLTVVAVIGLAVYHRRPCVEKELLRLGISERLAGEWEDSFPADFALLMAAVPKSTSTMLRARFSKTIRSPLFSPSTGGPCFNSGDREGGGA